VPAHNIVDDVVDTFLPAPSSTMLCAGTQGVDTFLRRTEEQFCPESDSEYIVMMK
jgi:hypothetical protein